MLYKAFLSIWISRNIFNFVQKSSQQIFTMNDHQFYNFNMAIGDMTAVTEFVTTQAHNGNKGVESI